jgi:excisionase family DNA binding protein
MAGLSLREAAQLAKTSKSTILRAIQSGRLSATRTDDGGYSIDPAELCRVYPPRPDAPDQSADQSAGQGATGLTEAATELRIRNAQLEAGFNALKAILEAEKKHLEEIREDRDRWAAQAERLALPAPDGSHKMQAQGAMKRGLFGWINRP